MTSASPAPWLPASWLIVGSRVSAADEAPMSRRICSNVSTVCCCWPTRPTSESSAMMPGKSASTE